MTGALLHPLTLQFGDGALEADFREQYARRSLLFVRAALVLGVSQYLLFAVFDDVLAAESAAAVRTIRLVGAAIATAALVYTFAPSFVRTMQPVLAGTALAGGLGVVGMVWAAQTVTGYYDYYIGMVLVLMYMHVLFRLRFVWATAVGVVLVVAYAVVAVAVETPGPVLLNSVFFMVSALLAGGVASYGLERYARYVFLQERRQRATNEDLAAALDDLRAAQKRLVQEQKMAGIGRLASGLAHELMNPLNFVQNFADLDAGLAAEAKEALDAGDAERARAAIGELADNAGRVRHHARRADSVIRGLLDHAPESRTLADRRPIDLNAFVAEHVQDVYQTARQRRSGWECSLTLDLDPAAGQATADPRDLGRVLASILHNAFDATSTGPSGDGRAAPSAAPSVTVRTRRRGAGVVVEVEDNGPGIPVDLHGRVFEPFYTTKPPGEGTGLGLSLAYEIVTNGYGGGLDVESREGEGAVFRVSLPA